MKRPFFVLVLSLLAVPLARSQPADDGLEVEGLRGTLPHAAVSQTVGTRMSELLACVGRRASGNDLLSGRVTLGFVVARNGATRVARIAESTIGDREAERCMTSIAASLRFPAPTGGEADVSETVQFPLDPEVRPPLVWTEDQVRTAVGPALDRLATRCHVSGGAVRVSAYVGRGGHVVSVGAHASAAALDPTIDCVLGAVSGLSLPDPGSYPAKVTFSVGR